MDAELIKEMAIPFCSLTLGGVLYQFVPRAKIVGIFMVFFGAQTGMNLYMKAVLSNSVVDEVAGLKGIPASFLVTAFQQMAGFVLFWIGLGISRLITPYKYVPKQLTTPFELFAVCLFAVSFTMNIALNNFSLSLVSISINLIIRSCLPLSTFLSQQVSARITKQPVKEVKLLEVGLMLLGVICAGIAVMAKMHISGKAGAESKNLVFGVIVCVISLFSGSINLALAGVLGTSIKLNSLDTTVYNAIPATLLLLGPIFLYAHPVNWPNHGSMTDWEIFNIVYAKSPSTIGLAALSGAFSLAYNTLQYGIVQCLSATHVAFAGNFNKAVTIPLALLVGLEHLPPGKWGVIMLFACFGSIGAFAVYNAVSGGAGGHGGHSAPPKNEKEVELEDGEDDDDSSEDDSESSEETGCFK